MKRLIFIVIIAILTASSASAQVKSELKTEKDGFQWYETSEGIYVGVESVNGKTLIPLSRKYTFICYHSEPGHKGYFTVQEELKDVNDSKQGACDIYGNVIIAPKYRFVFYSDNDGFMYANKDWKYIPFGITLDANGKASSYKNGTSYKDNDDASPNTSYSNSSVNKASTPTVGAQVRRELKTESNGFQWYRTYERGYYGAEDINGHTIIPLDRGYTFVTFRTEKNIPGYFRVKKNDKYGACNLNGIEIIATGKYESIIFSETDATGYYKVKLNGLYGAYDIDGREIIAPKYNTLVCTNSNFSYKDSHGNWIKLGITLDATGHASSYESASSSPAVAYTPPSSSTAPKSSTPSASTTTSPSKADVDINIPQGDADKSNTYVFIIANEHYPQRNVPYAINDGEIFKQYCEKTLGIQSNHIRLYKDATTSNILACVENMKLASSANNGQLNIIFYYAGHAFPDERTKSAYLLPVDGEVTLLSTCYSLNSLYKALNAVKARSVVCFIDACFSGATRENEMLLAGRGVAIKPKDDVPQGNVVVFTSASGAETAHQYKDKNHGLFTYFLLKKLRETKGSVTLGELGDYLTNEVKRTSFDVNNRIQTPTVIPSPTMAQKWRGLKL